jgi:hypothetical protein
MSSDKFEHYFETACQIFELEQKIDKVKSLRTETPSEWEKQKNQLEQLRKEIEYNRAIVNHKEEKSPGEITLEMKAAGKLPWEIAGFLKEAYNLSSHQIGNLLPARPEAPPSRESISRRGRKLLQEWQFKKNPE